MQDFLATDDEFTPQEETPATNKDFSSSTNHTVPSDYSLATAIGLNKL